MFHSMRSATVLGGLALFTVAGCASPAAQPANGARCPEGAVVFWDGFRAAVLDNQPEAIQARTRFPFVTKGTLDDDKKKTLNAQEFKRKWPTLLAQDSGLSPDGAALPMKVYVKSYGSLQNKDCSSSGKEFRVGSWVFSADATGWHFSQAYLE